jgi:uncharacterized protein YhfF/8-oxo-dGTP pyrophosphatase MutT (NUDIX family)
MEIKNHFGVYGICFENGKLLCIEKTRGPYQHRFDLPGGSQEAGEGLTETLKREVLEETGYTLSSYSNPRMYDVLVQEEGQDFAVHHIMAFYDIVLDFENSQKSLPHEVLDGSNDSANAIWIPFEQITEENASPLVLKVKAELVGIPELELTSYINWKTKEGEQMKPQEMWNAYKQINPSIGDEIDAWAFGVEADLLADLVLKGEKTATASAYDLYAVDNDPLPQEGTFDVILDSQDQAVCIVEVTKVSVQPFHQVSADHAYKEGEGDKSLAYWRQVHEEVFTEWMSEAGLTFTPDSKVVLEEFRKVYPL